MSDLRDQLRRLTDDVAGMPRPEASEVRRRADRRRRDVRVAGVAVFLVAMVAAVVTTAYVRRDDPAARLGVVASPSSTPAPAAAAPVASGPWLAAPWMLRSARSYTWPAGQPSPYAFCGHAYTPTWPVDVREQTLEHPNGQRALLLELSARVEGPIQLFKWSYASCVTKGRVEGVGGPRNLWSYGALAAGSEPVGATLHLVEIVGASAREPASRRDAETALDSWADR